MNGTLVVNKVNATDISVGDIENLKETVKQLQESIAVLQENVNNFNQMIYGTQGNIENDSMNAEFNGSSGF